MMLLSVFRVGAMHAISLGSNKNPISTQKDAMMHAMNSAADWLEMLGTYAIAIPRKCRAHSFFMLKTFAFSIDSFSQ